MKRLKPKRYTDEGREVPRGPLAKRKPNDDDMEAFDWEYAAVRKAGGYALKAPWDPPWAGANCHGFTFDRGGSQINEADVKNLIIPDNYDEVDCDEAHFCDVVVYGYDDGTGPTDHSGLVVEIGKDGKPARIVSKWGPTGGVFVHPPQTYLKDNNNNDWQVFRRNDDPEGLDKLRDAYKAAKKKYGASSKEAHLAAMELCQKKNALAESFLI